VSDAEQLRALFADWERGDFGRGVRLYADDMRFTTSQPEGLYEGRGPAGVRRFMEGFLPTWDFYAVKLDQLEELGAGRYLATGTQFARGKQSGTETRQPAHVAFRMEGGQITLLGFFFVREDALAALDETPPAP
jgi:ketosteroid isomerase-like protein